MAALNSIYGCRELFLQSCLATGTLLVDLLEALVAKPQREIAGSETAARFDFQKSWAFCQMLRRHMSGAEYLVAFEFHDDVVFIDPDTSKGAAEFFQVKTSSSATPRKLADLTRRKSSNTNSILGKMFQNFSGIWSNHSVRVILVSNVAFEFADKDLPAAKLDSKVRARIAEKLAAELPDFEEKQLDSLHFMITGVSIETIHSYLHGEALELFKSHFGEGHGFNVHSWVRLIQSEIARKNNQSSDKIVNVPDLIANKCVTRAFITGSLNLLAESARPPLDMTIVNVDLSQGGWSTTDLMRLTKRMAIATADYSDSANLEAATLIQRLKALLDSLSDTTLANFVAEAQADVMPTLAGPYRERFYLGAMCVLVFNEKL